MKKYILLIFASLLAVLLCGCDLDDIAKETKETKPQYTVGNASVSEQVDRLHVEWTSGNITIGYHDKDTIDISEESDAELDEKEQLNWYLEGTTLNVRFQKPGLLNLFSERKNLTILLPRDFTAKEWDVSASSADIVTESLSADKLDFSTSSGKINLAVLAADEVDLETSSGEIQLQGDSIKSTSIESSSGKVTATLQNNVDEIEIETSSGAVALVLPESLGFTAEIDTASGDFNSNFAFVQNGNRYVHNNGGATVEIETASGNISIQPN